MDDRMNLRPLGKSEIKITPVIMGTWQAGKTMWAGIDDNETKKAIKTAYDLGITTFDTAEVYGNGHSEKIIGDALKDVMDDVIIATKVFSNHLKYQQVIKACHRSLKNLNRDYIDLYQVHWPSGSFGHAAVTLEETMSALNELKDQGKIRSIGVSNFNIDQLSDASEYAVIDSLQPPYSLFWRMIEKEIMPYCLKNNITILAYSSMAQGLLTGKFQPGHIFTKEDNRKDNILFKHEHYERALKAVEQLKPIAQKYGVSTGQLALAWVFTQPGVCAIAGARNANQVLMNAESTNLIISDTDLFQISEIGKFVTDHLDERPVMWQW